MSLVCCIVFSVSVSLPVVCLHHLSHGLISACARPIRHTACGFLHRYFDETRSPERICDHCVEDKKAKDRAVALDHTDSGTRATMTQAIFENQRWIALTRKWTKPKPLQDRLPFTDADGVGAATLNAPESSHPPRSFYRLLDCWPLRFEALKRGATLAVLC